MKSKRLDRILGNTLISALFLASSAVALGDEINLTAAPANAALPDGESVPMWGYSCNATQPAPDSNPATCRALKPSAGSNWSPVLITVGQGSLTINLTNNLPTSPGASAGIPTSLVIVGQLGGGLGSDPAARSTASPDHPHQGTTWPGTRGPVDDPSACGGDSGVFCPPAQGARVQSFATEVAKGSTTALTWSNLRPGTYLIESGTHPSIQGAMGLYGVLVVTAPDVGSAHFAYPGVAYDSDVPLLLSEIDAVQNRAVAAAVATEGFSETKVWSGQAGKCGDLPPSNTAVSGEANTCYPPAVNYDPRYYLVNGVSFDRSTPASSRFTYAPTTSTGKVLVRFVNAGLRMHAPSIVGALTGNAPGIPGIALVAEDGNPLPGAARVQSNVLLPAGKTYDVMINAPAGSAPLPVFDRQLSLSTNNQRDGGMQAYINATTGSDPAATSAVANPDTYYKVSGNTLTVGDVGKGVLANDLGVFGAHVVGSAPAGLNLNTNGTFTFTGAAGATFIYCGNGASSGSSCATVTLAACTGGCLGGAPNAADDTYTGKNAQRLQIAPPGILTNDSDPTGLPITVDVPSVSPSAGLALTVNADGSFTASAAPGAYTFTYKVKNSQNSSSADATVSVNIPSPNNLNFVVRDAKTGAPLDDYRWIIEEDRTVYIDPSIETKPLCTGSNPVLTPPACSDTPVRNLAVNFHSSHMPVIATGCTGPLSCESGQMMVDPMTGAHVNAVCDIGNGACRPDTEGFGKAQVNPNQVALDPTKRYYISVLPGDAANDTETDAAHSMGGASISSSQVAGGSATTVSISVQPLPFPSAQISVFVFEDDFPLNGESDTGGGVDVLAPNEPGLGSFSIVLLDQTGQFGDPAGQLTYDEFGQPVSNALAHTIDPATGLDACPISPTAGDKLVGMIVTCPKFEANADGTPSDVLSALAGHALIKNMYPGLYEVHTTPGADRIANGEEWLQTNTLDGTRDIEAFVKPDEPSYFQEFGPGGYHVAVGFANPAIINSRKPGVCQGQTCNSSIYGKVTGLRMSRTPDQRVYSSGSYDTYGFAQCYVSLGAPDAADFAFTKCNDDGTFSFTGLPQGDFKVTVFDQWDDLLVDGLSTPIKVEGGSAGTPEAPIEVAVTQWRTNLYGRIFLDQNGDGVSQENEPGLPLVPYNIRYRDGSYMGFNNTDLAGNAGFNEVFPFLNWLVVDTDSARYKLASAHVVYDAGGAVDGTTGGGTSSIGAGLANTKERWPVPPGLRVPGARYCASADCPLGDTAGGSSGRVDPGWVPSEGWQGLLGQNSFIEFAMRNFAPAENGGIRGHVIYTSTRPFDDPALLLQLSWEPGVADVKVNLYQEGVAADGTKTLKLVDTTATSSWDAWAQGFRRDANGGLVLDGGRAVPNMSCPGQDDTSPFYYTMKDSTQALAPDTAMAANARFKCYDGWSMLNQVQPVPYNGMYKFPSVVAKSTATATLPAQGDATYLQFDPTSYKTNCTVCTTGPDGTPMLPPGKYVVEVVVPDGYELVKEEDKNILLGDVYDAPVEAQFAGFGAIFIMPDQAQVNANYNKFNEIQSTANNNASPRHEGDTGSVETFWPCVGAMRIVPDFNSLFPGAGQQAPFAGVSRPLCDRKEITLDNQMTALAKFYLFTSAHVSGHYTGTITDDFASEFDPFSPQFGEKFAVPNVPVAIKDFTGKEITRVYADQWGLFNGLTYSTWTVNPPSPSGYIPQMMIACMNDPGPIPGPNGSMIQDPAYNPGYSNYCYEIPFMPGETAYLDTPVIPTMAFADGYNLPDCDYPDLTPSIASVLGDTIPGSGGGRGPWVSAAGTGHTLTINALGDKRVLNHAYSGPNASTSPFNQKFITRHYGFGSRPGNCPSSGNCLSATVAGVPLVNVTTWTNDQIVGTVPTISNGQSTCTISQRTNPQNVGQSARCGELVVTASNGKKSIDTVTVTVAGKPPKYVTQSSPSNNVFGRLEASPLQTAIDSAAPGDLLIVAAGSYRENLLMWKPVRLQGVGANSVTINGDAHPAGKLDAWRRQANCVFGLTAEGRPTGTPYGDCTASMLGRVDRMPLEGVIGWDTTSNGNLAQQLQEPTLMGAYEGAGITILARGIRLPNGTTPDQRFGVGNEGAYPAGFSYLSNSNNDCNVPNNPNTGAAGFDYGSSNFLCNPSRIDGVSVINSSQGGGGIFAHGWNHQLEVSNTHVYANHGTLTGGITIGTGEFPDPYLVGGDTPLPNNLPANGLVNNEQAGYGFNRNVRVHNNAVTSNASIGDALYSSTNSAGGGVTFCSGADGYRFNDNWVCGNLSSGDGGGVVHSGFTNDGTIAHNAIIFNQSTSPTIPTNGGGLAILGASPDRTFTSGPNAGQECGSVSDADCPPALAEGTGRNLLIDGNLIVGNSAESGTGGGLRLQLVNGQDVIALPTQPTRWNDVRVVNNIITNNVAGWDGAGISLQDSLRVSIVNNTVMMNDTTASAGVLFNTLGAPLGSTPPPGCHPQEDPSLPQDPSCDHPVKTSEKQTAGLVTMRNTPNMDGAIAALPGAGNVRCPSGNSSGNGANNAVLNGDCRRYSYPQLRNNVFWHNRAFNIEVAPLLSNDPDDLTNQQKVVTLVPSLNQTSTGFCAATGTASDAPGSGGPAYYWEIGVRGDTSPTPGSSLPGNAGLKLEPRNSILTNSAAYPGSFNNLGADPAVLRQYCNGTRLPPENGGHGYSAPAGHSETTGLYPVFAINQITPAATVDEGNNWINLGFGPLSLVNPVDGQTILGNYAIGGGSPAVNQGSPNSAPSDDFFGNSRPQGSGYDIGAVEYVTPPVDLAVTKTDGRTTVQRGNSLTYTIVVTNNGPVAASGATLTDTLPGGSRFSVTSWSCVASAGSSCTATGSGNSTRSGTMNLANLGTATYTLVGTVQSGAPLGSMSNTAETSGGNDPVSSNDTATDTDTIVPPVAFTALTGPGSLSDTTLDFGNLTGAQSATLTITANTAVTFGTAQVSNLIINAFSKGADTCSGHAIAAGGTCTIVINFAAPGGTNLRLGAVSIPYSGASGSPLALILTGR
jgi:uncharacterized repeat protein (TIGR01451 family)